eukprot:SAG22_NODE_1278_length_4905_cov_1.660216_1_plen_503_part_00
MAGTAASQKAASAPAPLQPGQPPLPFQFGDKVEVMRRAKRPHSQGDSGERWYRGGEIDEVDPQQRRALVKFPLAGEEWNGWWPFAALRPAEDPILHKNNYSYSCCRSVGGGGWWLFCTGKDGRKEASTEADKAVAKAAAPHMAKADFVAKYGEQFEQLWDPLEAKAADPAAEAAAVRAARYEHYDEQSMHKTMVLFPLGCALIIGACFLAQGIASFSLPDCGVFESREAYIAQPAAAADGGGGGNITCYSPRLAAFIADEVNRPGYAANPMYPTLAAIEAAGGFADPRTLSEMYTVCSSLSLLGILSWVVYAGLGWTLVMGCVFRLQSGCDGVEPTAGQSNRAYRVKYLSQDAGQRARHAAEDAEVARALDKSATTGCGCTTCGTVVFVGGQIAFQVVAVIMFMAWSGERSTECSGDGYDAIRQVYIMTQVNFVVGTMACLGIGGLTTKKLLGFHLAGGKAARAAAENDAGPPGPGEDRDRYIRNYGVRFGFRYWDKHTTAP